MTVVGVIEPSLRQAEIERVKRKRPDNLDAYDLVLRAIPYAYLAMPAEAASALPFIEKALALEPNYALAHGLAAFVHEIMFVRGGQREENHAAALRHAHAAIANGRDDAMALSFGAFVIGIIAHDRRAALQAFEAAIALSSSCAFAYGHGAVIIALGGDPERAIEWGERALRLSPIDPFNFGPYFAIALGHFQLGHYEAAAEAARKTFQANPTWSYAHMALAATLTKLGHVEEAKAAARRVLELQPGYTISGMRAAVPVAPVLAEPLTEALRAAGLPDK